MLYEYSYENQNIYNFQFSRDPNYHSQTCLRYLYKFPIFFFRQSFCRFVLPFYGAYSTCCKRHRERQSKNRKNIKTRLQHIMFSLMANVRMILNIQSPKVALSFSSSADFIMTMFASLLLVCFLLRRG